MNLLISEVESKMDFYKYLNYALGNEDWDVEEQALRVSTGDKVVCVTASGDRPLHLLMTDCAEILSIDMNKAQNHLLDLKVAAITHLDFEKYLAFLGCNPTPHRYDIFKEIKAHLPQDAAHFWEQKKKMIVKGILYQGRTERFTHLAGSFFSLIRGKKIKTLLSFSDMQEQRNFIAKSWDTFFLRKLFQIFADPKFTRLLLKDPGFNSYVDPSNPPGTYIYQRMLRYLNHYPARESPLFQLLFTGRILPSAYFPYLTYDGYTKIRGNMNRLTYITTNIVEYLNNIEANQVDCFSLSDIASYMPQQAFERLLYGVQNAAKPNARFCIREFMSKRFIPSDLKANFLRNHELEQKLESEEPNFVYRFMVGEVQK